MEALFKAFADQAALAIEVVAVLVVFYGSVEAFVKLLRVVVTPGATHGERKAIWRRFGMWLLLGLEFELASDIIASVVAPTWDDLGKLGAIAVIRTFLNYFLERDLEADRGVGGRSSTRGRSKLGADMSSAETPLSDATKLAVERTRLAHERTLMAWVRTSTSLISFGFTIHKFFEYLRESGQSRSATLFGPREFALTMIGIGITVLVLATIEHRIRLKELRTQYREVPYSLATFLAALISFLGVVGFLSVSFRRVRSRPQRAADRFQERVATERFVEHVDGARGQGLVANVILRVSGDEDNRRGAPLRAQSPLQIEPAHRRHADIQDQAVRLRRRIALAIRGGAFEGLDLVPGRLEKTTERAPDGEVVIDDADDRVFDQRNPRVGLYESVPGVECDESRTPFEQGDAFSD